MYHKEKNARRKAKSAAEGNARDIERDVAERSVASAIADILKHLFALLRVKIEAGKHWGVELAREDGGQRLVLPMYFVSGKSHGN